MVLATRVFVAFEPVRIKALEAPVMASAGVVGVRVMDERANALRPPFAVIARIRHDSTERQAFSIHIDGQAVCGPTLAGGAARRVDCVLAQDWDRASGHDVVIEGPMTPWTLEYLELATHHGNSTGALNVFVLPAASLGYSAPHPAWPFVLWPALTALLILPRPRPTSRVMALVQRGLAAPVVTLFTLLLIAPIVSPYRVVLSAWTFAGWLFLALAPRPWSLSRQLAQKFPSATRVTHRMAAWSIRAFGQVWGICRIHDEWLAWALSVAVCGVGLAYGTRALGSADTYGYVSQAELWLSGNLSIDQPFAKEAPWPQPEWTFAPLGYRPRPVDNRAIVPVYSPGLPMLLAAAKLLGGQDAMFHVVPLCGGLLVLATYGLGRRLGSGAVGVIGAWLVATSPVVLGHLFVTMTDVPVAAAWSAAFYLLLGTNFNSAAGAGLLSGVAILIRPNLAPLAAIMGMHYAFRMRDASARRRAVGQLLVFGIAVLPGALAVAAINQHLFGSPLVSGYGTLGDLFAWTRVAANLRNYLGWLVDAHTPVVLCGLVAIFVPLRRWWPGAGDRSVFVVIGAFVIALWAIYSAWAVFGSWWFSRFLLSSWPFIMLGVGAMAMAIFRTAVPFIKPVVVGSVVMLGIVQIQFATNHSVFLLGRGEGRNVVVARLARQVTEPNSVLVSLNHSGSLRYYAGRMTLNFAHLDKEWLDRTVDWLEEQGVHPYAVLEEWEIPEFRARFAGARSLATLDRPVAIYEEPGKLMIFDLSERGSQTDKSVVATGLETGKSAVAPASLPQLVFAQVH